MVQSSGDRDLSRANFSEELWTTISSDTADFWKEYITDKIAQNSNDPRSVFKDAASVGGSLNQKLLMFRDNLASTLYDSRVSRVTADSDILREAATGAGIDLDNLDLGNIETDFARMGRPEGRVHVFNKDNGFSMPVSQGQEEDLPPSFKLAS